MDESIDSLDSTVSLDRVPIHCAGIDVDNPDDFCMAFYAEQGSQSIETNYRASMLASAAESGEEPVVIKGDVLLECDADLANRILQNDLEFQAHQRTVAAFRAWMRDYSEANNLEATTVFESVMCYGAHAYQDAAEKVNVQRVADILGMDPSQIGVVHL